MKSTQNSSYLPKQHIRWSKWCNQHKPLIFTSQSSPKFHPKFKHCSILYFVFPKYAPPINQTISPNNVTFLSSRKLLTIFIAADFNIMQYIFSQLFSRDFCAACVHNGVLWFFLKVKVTRRTKLNPLTPAAVWLALIDVCSHTSSPHLCDLELFWEKYNLSHRSM